MTYDDIQVTYQCVRWPGINGYTHSIHEAYRDRATGKLVSIMKEPVTLDCSYDTPKEIKIMLHKMLNQIDQYGVISASTLYTFFKSDNSEIATMDELILDNDEDEETPDEFFDRYYKEESRLNADGDEDMLDEDEIVDVVDFFKGKGRR